jgi:mycothiol system anti-sigma-R factor
MSWNDILLVVLVPLLLAEFGCWCGWLAGKLVPWAAVLRYGNGERAGIRSEEWASDLEDIPGQITKLAYAISLLAAGSAFAASRKLQLASARRGLTQGRPEDGHVLGQIKGFLDGKLTDIDTAAIHRHLDTCGACLREYGLEEAVKRLVVKHWGCDPVPPEIRQKVLVRIKEVRATIESSG